MVQMADRTEIGFIQLMRSSCGEITICCEYAVVMGRNGKAVFPRRIHSDDRAPLECLVTDYLAALGPIARR